MKYRRKYSRNETLFPEEYWKKGYEFEGNEASGEVVEERKDGKLLRIHVLEACEIIG